MQNFVISILKLLLVITSLLIIKDLSIYTVTRRTEDALNKHIPESIVMSNKSNKSNNTISQSLQSFNLILRPEPQSITVIHIKQINTNKTWTFNTSYRDSNSNNLVDIGDRGYVTPGSTIKLLITYCLYKKKDLSSHEKYVVKKALVLSDNNAANTMIDWIGGIKEVQDCFTKEGFSNTYINRYFGSSKPITSNKCREGNVYSNCTTSNVLVQVMEYLITGSNTLNLHLSEPKRKEIVSILSLRPKDIGSNKPNDYCAFIKELGPQKCGVALLDSSISNIAYIPSKQLVVFIGFKGNRINDNQMSNVIHSLYLTGLNQLKGTQ